MGSKNNRIAWLDSSRGIAFIMVIYSHLEFHDVTLMKFFSPVFLTTFFFVSGYLFKSNTSFREILEQRTRTLFIPFLIYGTLLLLTRQLFSFREEVTPFKESFISMICQFDKESRFIWFIPALYVYSLLFYWINRFSLNNPKLLFILSSLLFSLNWFLCYLIEIPKLPYTLNTAGFGCAYMGLGKVYRHYESFFNTYFKKKYIIYLASFYTVMTYYFPPISFMGSKYMIDSLIITVIGLFIIVYFAKKDYISNKLILFVGSNSLLYFCLHGKVYALLQGGVHIFVPSEFLHNYIFCYTISILITLADVLVLILPILLINHYAAFTIGKGYKLWK